MTISAVRTRPSAGFTLLEVVIVLAVTAMLLGGAVGLMVFSSDERVLRHASGEIELLAKRARTMAILRQAPYALEFRERQVRMMPLGAAGHDEKTTVGGRPIGGQAVESGESTAEYTWPAGMSVAVRRWASNDWQEMAKKNVQVWRFDSNGLCEPVSVRLTVGSSWAEDTFHPLTATIRDSQLEAR